MQDSQDEGSWGNVRFRPRRLRGGVEWADAESRFVTGLVVFVIAALLYPWYEYRVQAWLLGRDMEAASKTLQKELGAEAAGAQARVDAAKARQPAAYRAPASIRIMGAMELRDGPLAIVDLAGRSLDDVAPVICLRVQETLGAPTAGRQIRIQRWRGSAPAVSVGSIQC